MPARPATVLDAIAIHQYSSGTVGVPHGVRISHRNLLHNSELIRRAFVHTSKQRGLVWLPPYHDMGLIGGIVQPLYAGFRTTLMAPRTFLRSPLNWLRAITMTGATTSGGPNFAYESCLAASDDEIERANLDLSRWLVAFNGAETVNPATLRQFATRFRRFGFRMASFTSCYGLAEATLIVSASSHLHKPSLLDVDRNALAAGQIRLTTKADREHRRLVGLGTPLQAVRVIKQDGSEASPYDVGEIWVAGDSVAEPVGDEDSAFHAQLPDDPAQYVRTGDLGFVYKGELYVVGRSKAIVLVRSRNHHAEDMEASCRALEPALAQMGAAAFGDDEAGIAVVLEVPAGIPTCRACWNGFAARWPSSTASPSTRSCWCANAAGAHAQRQDPAQRGTGAPGRTPEPAVVLARTARKRRAPARPCLPCRPSPACRARRPWRRSATGWPRCWPRN
ncbi:AMP-binding protein [Achromobacter xylosoxidans]